MGVGVRGGFEVEVFANLAAVGAESGYWRWWMVPWRVCGPILSS